MNSETFVVPKELFDEYKCLMMYFNEPLIEGSSLNEIQVQGGNAEIEGASGFIVAQKMAQTISGMGPNLLGQDTVNFGEFLRKGINVMTVFRQNLTVSAPHTAINNNTAATQEGCAEKTQRALINELETGTPVILPMSWMGHAIVIIFRKAHNFNYDMTVINTGQGLEFHHWLADPNNSYFAFPRSWIEFKNIPKKVIFPNNFWFFMAFQHMNIEENAKEIESSTGTLQSYFYGSLLSNLVEYFVEPDKSHKKLIPAQRSGTCTISSLMAALLYSVSDELEFYKSTVTLGHELIKKFLEKYAQCPLFLRMISDGYDSTARKIFKSTASSLARHILLYLEKKFPESMMNSGLLGPGKHSWIYERKASAVAALEASKDDYELVKATVELALKVENIIKDIKIDERSRTMDLSRVIFEFESVSFDFTRDEWQEDNLNTMNQFALTVDRPVGKIESLNDLTATFRRCTAIETPGRDMACVQDAFERVAIQPEWWTLVQNNDSLPEIIEFLESCSDVVRKYTSNPHFPNTLDDLLPLANLEMAIWLAVVKYDNLGAAEVRLGLENFKPPINLPRILEKYEIIKHMDSGGTLNWPFMTVFSSESIRKVREIFVAYSKIATASEEFFLKFDKSFRTADFPTTRSNFFTYRNILSRFAPQIREFRNYKQSKKNCFTQTDWINDLKVDKIYLLERLEDIERVFPQFGILIRNFTLIGARVGFAAFKIGTSLYKEAAEATEIDLKTVYLPSINFDFNPTRNINDKYRCIGSCSSIKKNPDGDVFTKLRHSQSLVVRKRMVNFDAWMNYVRSSEDGTIFQDAYFAYLSNHILNMPKYSQDPNGAQPFSSLQTIEVFDEMYRLIDYGTSLISKQRFHIDPKLKDKLIKMAINVSIILVRFLERADLEKYIVADQVATMQAKIYKSLAIFGKFGPENVLDESQISDVNLVLAQICNAHMRNPKTFIDDIAQIFRNNTAVIYRKTLARFHWMMANLSHVSGPLGRSHADDLFSRGFQYHPISQSECPFTDKLIKDWFLPKYVAKARNVHVSYESKGEFVVINMKIDSVKNSMKIHFPTGIVFYKGDRLISRDKVIDTDVFRNYFPSVDEKRLALKGYGAAIGSFFIYVVPNYHTIGNNVVLLRHKDKSEIYRKFGGNWYRWNCKNMSLYQSPRLNWINNYKYYESNDGALLIKDKDELPLAIIRSPQTFEIWGTNEAFAFELWNYDSKGDEESHVLEKHIRRFTANDTWIGMKGDAIVVVYPGLRMRDDPKRPVILLEIPSENDHYNHEEASFRLINSPDLIIESDQKSLNSAGIIGTLMAKNSEGQHFLLATAPQIDLESDDLDERPFHYIEKIPLVENVPSPQTRSQRLLMAYYCIHSREFTLARELLHPFTSINQNEPFDEVELNIIEWIINSKNKNLPAINGPEATSLRLMTILHAMINSRKFPLSSVGESLLIFKSAFKDLQMKYFDSLRDLPEKYHLQRIFPEYFSPDIQRIIVQSLKLNTVELPDVLTNNEFDLEISTIIKEDLKPFEKIGPGHLACSLSGDRSSLQTKIFKHRDLNINLMYRLKQNQTNLVSNLNSYEGFYLCSLLSTSASAIQLYQSYIKESSEFKFRENLRKQLKEEIERNFKLCKGIFSDRFKYVNASKDSTNTNPYVLLSQLNTNSKSFARDAEIQTEKLAAIEPIKSSDRAIIKEVIRNVQSLLQPDKTLSETPFKESSVAKSKVLSKLFRSINEFVTEKGQYDNLEINLNEHNGVLEVLKRMRLYLEFRIRNLRDIEAGLAADLISNLGTDDDHLSAAHSFEIVNRLMHQKKPKAFNSLYGCYQKLSVSCIQEKFPQLEWNTCEALLIDSMRYYSTHILLEFFGTILEKVENFIKLSQKRETVAIDDLMLFLDEAEKIEDFNERLKTPAILNFEYRSKKYRLRKEQVKDIDDLTTIDESTGLFKSSVIQRMMAAGKTLVLGTISVVKKALDRGKLSILVPPSSLYQSNLSAMQARTYGFFKTRGHNFIFPRLTFNGKNDIAETVIPFLKLILRDIERIQQRGDYLVLSPDSLQSFLNSYVELINFYTTKFKNGVVEVDQDSLMAELEALDALKLYAELFNLFRSKGSIILDEIDMTMDPKKELNFPTIEKEPFNMTAVVLITDLIEFSVFDERVREIGLDIHGNNQSGLTGDCYEKYLSVLIEYIKTQLEDPASLWSETFADVDHENIVQFFSQQEMGGSRKWIRALRKDQKGILADALIIVKVQITKKLQEAFKGTANLNFGLAGALRPDTEYAIPYLAANTPSPSSEFADRWETLIKTLLTLAAVDCPLGVARNMIAPMKKRCLEESSLSVSIKETTTSLNMVTLIPEIDLFTISEKDDDHVKMLHRALKTRSPAAIRLLFSYAVDSIFANMKFPIEQITSNALNMTSMFGSVQGYSGTIDNVNILPREVINGAYQNHMQNEKNNGGIALKLIKDSQKSKILCIKDEALRNSAEIIVKTMIEGALASESDRRELSALIDTGAFFKNFKNREIAHAILKVLNPRISVVLYYNEDSNQVEFLKHAGGGEPEIGYISSTDPDTILKATQAEIHRRFTFYDQRHITGSDIFQPKTARALMTVGTRVLLRDILQGTLRMRQFMTSQKVHLITSVAAARFYYSKAYPDQKFDNSPIFVSDMISLGAFNEDEKQEQENEALAYAKIDNEIRRFVLNQITRALLESQHPAQIMSIWFKKSDKGAIRNLFVRSIKENAMNWMNERELKDTREVLSNYAESWINILAQYSVEIGALDLSFAVEDDSTRSGEEFKKLKEALQSMTSPPKDESDKVSLLSFMKETTPSNANGDDCGGQIETQVLMQQLAEFDLEKLVQTFKPSYRDYFRTPFSLNTLSSQIKTSSLLNLYDKRFVAVRDIMFHETITPILKNYTENAMLTHGKRIAVDIDLLKVIETAGTGTNYSIIFSDYTLEGSHILVQVLPNNSGIRAVLLSVESAEDVAELLQLNSLVKRSSYWLCDLSGSVRHTTEDKSTRVSMNILDFMPASRELIFDLLVFNGSFDHIIKSEHLRRIYYNKWLNSHNFKDRAIFLLVRMRVLANKHERIFDNENKHLKLLLQAARGSLKSDSEDRAAVGGLYKKPGVSSSAEDEYFNVNKYLARPTSSLLQGTSIPSFRQIIEEIIGKILGMLSLSDFAESSELFDYNYDETNLVSAPEDFVKIEDSSHVVEWLEIIEDADDIKDSKPEFMLDLEDEIESDEEPEEEIKSELAESEEETRSESEENDSTEGLEEEKEEEEAAIPINEIESENMVHKDENEVGKGQETNESDFVSEEKKESDVVSEEEKKESDVVSEEEKKESDVVFEEEKKESDFVSEEIVSVQSKNELDSTLSPKDIDEPPKSTVVTDDFGFDSNDGSDYFGFGDGEYSSEHINEDFEDEVENEVENKVQDESEDDEYKFGFSNEAEDESEGNVEYKFGFSNEAEVEHEDESEDGHAFEAEDKEGLVDKSEALVKNIKDEDEDDEDNDESGNESEDDSDRKEFSFKDFLKGKTGNRNSSGSGFGSDDEKSESDFVPKSAPSSAGDSGSNKENIDSNTGSNVLLPESDDSGFIKNKNKSPDSTSGKSPSGANNGKSHSGGSGSSNGKSSSGGSGGGGGGGSKKSGRKSRNNPEVVEEEMRKKEKEEGEKRKKVENRKQEEEEKRKKLEEDEKKKQNDRNESNKMESKSSDDLKSNNGMFSLSPSSTWIYASSAILLIALLGILGYFFLFANSPPQPS